jgi:transcriptional regulator with XRE-family HTH domain
MNYQKQLEEILKKYKNKETAKLLGISVRSIQNYMYNRSIPHVSIILKIDNLHSQLHHCNGDQAEDKYLM